MERRNHILMLILLFHLQQPSSQYKLIRVYTRGDWSTPMFCVIGVHIAATLDLYSLLFSSKPLSKDHGSIVRMS